LFYTKIHIIKSNYVFVFDLVCNKLVAYFSKLGIFSDLDIPNKPSIISIVRLLLCFTAQSCNFSRKLGVVKILFSSSLSVFDDYAEEIHNRANYHQRSV